MRANPRLLPVLGLLVVAAGTLAFGMQILIASSRGDGVPVDLSAASRALVGWYLGLRSGDLEPPTTRVVPSMPFAVTPGESVRSIAGRLHELGLIRDPGLFVMLARHLGVDGAIVAGEYGLSPNMGTAEILEVLHSGRVSEISVTFPEGWRMEQVAERLAAEGVVEASEFLRRASSETFDFQFLRERPTGATLEGFLFPDTYRFTPNMDAGVVIERILENFDRRVNAEVSLEAPAAGLSLYEVLTLASLVERETVLAEERPLIAGVYLNRLRQGMLLEADSTVQYSLGFERGVWWPPITLEELRTVDSAYNTYLQLGLPPGPIASPGLASIQAVVDPSQTPYLYYYARGDGSHAFAVTFEEHLANQALYAGGS
ncbi:MAG: endolytic transglycosylase MltG [Anaerolineae bacterium]